MTTERKGHTSTNITHRTGYVSLAVIVFLIVILIFSAIPNVIAQTDQGSVAFLSDEGQTYGTSIENETTDLITEIGNSSPFDNLWSQYSEQEKSGALVNWIEYTDDAVSRGHFTTVIDSSEGGTCAVTQVCDVIDRL